ncbi:MAG: nitroreductase [Lachnospiraceae bacterium]|nr:nitroreductase [Lachnospiraceae bacterium]
MSVLETAKARSSVRDYTGQAVEEVKLQKILEVAHVAPTAANMQPVRLIVVRSREGLSAVSESANIYGAPVAIVVCADRSKAWMRPYDNMVTADIDASILSDHMMLMATELGLGSVWICYFKPDALKQGLNLPKNLEPINILALGYSAEPEADKDRHSQTRIPMDELVQYK